MIKGILRSLALAAGLSFAADAAIADITDGKFGINQIFDVQYYWSGNTLNASNFVAPYDSNFQQPTVSTGQYFQFINNNDGTYGLGLYNADSTLAQTVHSTGTITALGDGAIFYIGSGFFGNVITPSTGYNYGASATFADMNQSPVSSDYTGYTWASTTPLAAGQTATVTVTYPVSNADFASGNLTGWTAGGGTGTQTSTAYTGTGVGVAVVQEMTSYTANGSPYQWTVKPPTGTYMVSIQASSANTAGVNTFDDMATDLGISTASKNEIIAAMVATGNGSPTNAAWIKQDITLTNGQTFQMAWQYISTDYEPFNDGSITSLVNKNGTIVATVNGESKEYALIGFTNQGTGNYSVGSYGATGWQTASYTANEAGVYTLGFGSFNLSDTALSPILFVTKNVGTTFNFTTPFNPIAPNAGSSAPNNSTSPTVVSTAPGTPIVSSSSVNGTPVTTSITNTNAVNSIDADGNPVVTTYFTVTTTVSTPTTVTTTTTPVTITTYSDGSTASTNGTPVISTSTTAAETSNTTSPVLQSQATTTPVVSGTNTVPGVSTITESVISWPSIDTTTVDYSASKSGSEITVSQLTTVVTDQPYTTTTITDTPITTTTTVVPTTITVDANGNVINTSTDTPIDTDSTITQTVTTTTESNVYTPVYYVDVAEVNVGGMQDGIDWVTEHPFMVDPFTTADGAWAGPSMYWGSTSNGNMSGNNYAFGYQRTVDDITAGIAGSIGSMESNGYGNAESQTTSYNATAYVLNKGDVAWVKASFGIGYNEHSNNMSISSFQLFAQDTATQSIGYADVAVYAPQDMQGWRPFAGATVVMSNITNVSSSGIVLMSSPATQGTTTTVAPYVGAQYNIDKDTSIELRTTQSPTYGTVVSGKAMVKKEIAPNTNVNVSLAHSQGKNYDDTTVMVGLTWDF